jgi:hypothetical protein
MDWVWAEAVEARTKTACFGFSTCFGERFSSRRLVFAFLGFLLQISEFDQEIEGPREIHYSLHLSDEQAKKIL